jgi:hypothetical protein
MKSLVQLLLVLATLPWIGGCCVVAHALCPLEPPASPAPLTRDTPEEAVEFLIEAMGERRIKELYDSLHPRLVEDWGGFGVQDFRTAFLHYEDDFAEDASVLAGADRSETRYVDGVAEITLSSGDRRLTVHLVDAPSSLIRVDDEFFGTVRDSASFEPAAAYRLDGDRLRIELTLPLPADGIAPESITRLELRHDWQIVGWSDANNIRFLDRVREALGPDARAP